MKRTGCTVRLWMEKELDFLDKMFRRGRISLWRRLRAALPSTLFGLVAFSFALLGFGAAAYSSAIPGLAAASSSSSFGPFGDRVAESTDGVVAVARDALTTASAGISIAADAGSTSEELGGMISGALTSASIGLTNHTDSIDHVDSTEEVEDPDSLYPNSPAVTKAQDAEILATLLECYDDFERALNGLIAARNALEEAHAGNVSIESIDSESFWGFGRLAGDAASRARRCLLAADGSTYLANSRYSAQRAPIFNDGHSAAGPAEAMGLASQGFAQPCDDLTHAFEVLGGLRNDSDFDGWIAAFDQEIPLCILRYETALSNWVATVR